LTLRQLLLGNDGNTRICSTKVQFLGGISMSKQRLYIPDKVRIGEVLVQKGLIAQNELTLALLEQSNTQLKLGEILVQQGRVTRQQLNQVLKEQQRRNWTASALFALSTVVAAVPKPLFIKVPVTIEPSTKHTSLNEAQGGGTPMRQRKISPRANIQAFRNPPNQGFDIPLSANLRPTIASPLRGFCHPLNGSGVISQGIRGETHRGRMEYAYDLKTNIGTPVYAMRAGRVRLVEDRYPDTGGGAENISKFNYVLIEHDGGYRSAYIHLQHSFQGKVPIKVDDTVESGQLIGYSGNSGWSSGPHLHVEVDEPGETHSFSQTVPFAIAEACGPGSIARKNH
jgi:murein DD-endopeptidase MepM/ murein hydrolase activator NlpD